MFQFRRFPSYTYFIQCRMTEYCSAGFPHSVIHGSTLMCSSPWLIAACHDLLRLLMPRHSPCALSSLTYRIVPISKLVLINLESCRLTEVFTLQNCCVTLNSSTLSFNKSCSAIQPSTPLCCLAFYIHSSVQFSRCR